MKKDTILQGDSLEVLKTFPDESVDCVITSPPYWALRDYGVDGQLGQEKTFQEYINKLCDIFNEVKRVLKDSGTCWVNIGDTYGGTGDKKDSTDPKYKQGRNGQSIAINKSATAKSLCQIPSRFAIEMTDRGWILRNRLIWHKPNAMPSSAKDRFTVDYEDVFFFVKRKKYHFETQYEPYAPASYVRYRQALRASKSYQKKELYKNNTPYSGKFNVQNAEDFGSPRARYKRGQGSVSSRGDDSDGLVVGGINPNGRYKRAVWTIPTKPYKEAHFATYPEKLIEPMIKAGCPVGGIVLDCFFGAGTTGLVSKKLNRHYIGIELNPEYIKIAESRINPINEKSL